MRARERADLVRRLRHQFDWLLSQAAEYESGRPHVSVENGIVAAQRCAAAAQQFRKRAAEVAQLIAAHDRT